MALVLIAWSRAPKALLASVVLTVAAGCGLRSVPPAGSIGDPAIFRGAPGEPRIEVTADTVGVAIGDHAVSAGLADGTIRITTPFGPVACTASILHEGGWARPAATTREPALRQGRRAACATVVYPVPGERELHLEMEVFRGLPAVVVTTRLVRLGASGPEYYYWSTDLSPQRYSAPAGNAVREVPLNPDAWEAIPPHGWLWFPGASGGGLAVLQVNTAGRAPGAAGTLFLQALPRSVLLESGEAHQVRFAVAGTADAAGAAALAAAVCANPVAEVSPAALVRREPRPAFGPAAPAWLLEAEAYNLYYRPAAQWTDAVVNERLKHFRLIVGSTPDRAALEKCHAAGVRLLHYVTYTCLLDTDLQVRAGGQVYSEWLESIDCAARDLKDHPDWVCIDPRGDPQKDAWGQEHGHPGLLNTCLHQPGLQEAALRQVRLLMEMGFDGVFIDLAGPTPECHGPAFGRHRHAGGARTNTQAWEDLQEAVYREVKRHGADRVVMQNPCTGTLASHWRYCDLQMLEAFPYGSGSGDLRASPAELAWQGQRLAAPVAADKRPVILPYLSDIPADRVRDAALLSYAYARLHGFLWADAFTLIDRPEARELALALYPLRLGRPASPIVCAGPVQYRRFERGGVAINPSSEAADLELRGPASGPLVDVGYAVTLTPAQGTVRLTLAPQSGRVLLWP